VFPALAALLISASPGGVRGGYEKARWGMTLAEVKALYPEGVEAIKKERADSGSVGSFSYRLLRTVSGEKAVVAFFFEKHRLKSVGITFPARDSAVQLKGDLEYVVPSPMKHATFTLIFMAP
jgi:hypothetical protein